MVAVTREDWALERAETVLQNWAGRSGPDTCPDTSAPDPSAAREIARTEQAILQGDLIVLNEYGGLQAVLKRSVALKKLHLQRVDRTIIEGGSTWRAARLMGSYFGG